MTAEGLSALAMGFSGKDACEIRIRFVPAFKAVSDRLEGAECTISWLAFKTRDRTAGKDWVRSLDCSICLLQSSR
jgi:phage regulator Rha-like protein